MPTLHLVRHAKASRDAPVEDHDRPLAPRGRRAAPAMARWMAENGVAPELVLVSTARRCRETWAAMQAEFASRPAVEFEAGLYLAAAGDLLARLRRLPAGRREVMLIGHNPGLHELAVSLAGAGDGVGRRRLHEKFSTGALATLSSPASEWSGLSPGRLDLIRFIRPSDIVEEQ